MLLFLLFPLLLPAVILFQNVAIFAFRSVINCSQSVTIFAIPSVITRCQSVSACLLFLLFALFLPAVSLLLYLLFALLLPTVRPLLYLLFALLLPAVSLFQSVTLFAIPCVITCCQSFRYVAVFAFHSVPVLFC
jgi:hypothetical protein